MNSIEFEMIVYKEDKTYIAYCPELDLSSCGHTINQAKKMLKTAARLFIEEATKMGTLEDILEESHYQKSEDKWIPPQKVATELVMV